MHEHRFKVREADGPKTMQLIHQREDSSSFSSVSLIPITLIEQTILIRPPKPHGAGKMQYGAPPSPLQAHGDAAVQNPLALSFQLATEKA